MNIDEIKTLIQNTIAGQGSQVDVGGKLAEVLNSIIDNIPEIPEIPESVVFDFGSVPGSKEISKTDYDKAKNGLGIKCGGDAMPVLNSLEQLEYNFLIGIYVQKMFSQPQNILFFGIVRFDTGSGFNVYGTCYALAETSGRYYVVNLLN